MPAKRLALLQGHLDEFHIEVFCSYACIDRFADAMVKETGYRWCDKHGKWSETKGFCLECEIEAGHVQPVASPSASKGGES